MEIRRSYDRLISTMGFPIPVRQHLYIESGPSITPISLGMGLANGKRRYLVKPSIIGPQPIQNEPWYCALLEYTYLGQNPIWFAFWFAMCMKRRRGIGVYIYIYIHIHIYTYKMDCVCQRYHQECSTRTCADDCYNCWQMSKLKSFVRPWFHG